MNPDSSISSKTKKENKSLFRPCIDLHQGKVKQIIGATLSDLKSQSEKKELKENFVSQYQSDYYANLYKKDNLKGGHVIMLGSNNEHQAKLALKTYPYGLQIGGGITDQNALYWLDQKASHIIITSYIFYDGQCDWNRLKKIARLVSRDKLILDLSCSWIEDEYYIMWDRWQKKTSTKITKSVLEQFAEYCDEFLIHSIDVEGKQQGIDSRLIDTLANHSPIDCVYAGGISTIKDIEYIENLSTNHLYYTIGSGLDIFGGKQLNYEAVKARYN